LAFWQGDGAEARRIFTENMERAQKLGDQAESAYSLHKLANVTFEEGNVEQALVLNKRSIALSRDINAFWVLAMAQLALGYQEHTIGNLPRAEELYQESLRHCRQLGEKWGIALILANLGMIFYSKGDMPAAKRTLLESLELAHELGDKTGTIAVLAGIAKVLQEEGEQITSARLQGMITAKRSESVMYLGPVEQAMFDSAADALKESMGKQVYHTEFENGLTLTLEDALKLVSGQS
jgi:tetratricopeptide (TPR) repeat protein